MSKQMYYDEEAGQFFPIPDVVEQKPITNADRIRAMTDEELAWELARICRTPFYKDDSEIDEYEVDCWAKWLKQEVTTNSTT